MCRILAAKFPSSTPPQKLLKLFCDMSKQSRAPDGDQQGDGWGISWQQNQTWQRYTSLQPIWQDQQQFSRIPPTTQLAIHARSASFPHHKDILEFNQPFITDSTAFLFNGIIRKVNFPYPLAGQIGSQKLHSLYLKLRATHNPLETLTQIKTLLQTHAQEIQACNIAVVDNNQIYAMSIYTKFPDYYALRYFQSPTQSFVSSEPLQGYPNCNTLKSGEIINL